MAWPEPGWYNDPMGERGTLRRWTGTEWTAELKPAEEQAYSCDQSRPDTQSQSQYQANYQANTDPDAAYQQSAYYAQGTATDISNALYPTSETDRTLRLIAFVLNVISTVCAGFFIIPLAWMIPMTVVSWGIYKGTRPNTVAFGVCTLIFVDLISGILLLCSNHDR